MDQQLMTVEINGVKLEIDTRNARRIETLRVGSRVKALIKAYDGFKIYPGVVVGFDEFRDLPTINICYLDVDYAGTNLKFVGYNQQTKDVQIVAANDADELELSKQDVCTKIDKEIARKQLEIEELHAKREFFLAHFAAYFAVAQTI